MEDLNREQPMPTPNASPSIQDMVIADMETRKAIGLQRYGTLLQPNNGRDMLRDAYEEALDLAVYLRGAIAERDGAVVRKNVGITVFGWDIGNVVPPTQWQFELATAHLAEIQGNATANEVKWFNMLFDAYRAAQ